jgi:hypothetical protein
LRSQLTDTDLGITGDMEPTDPVKEFPDNVISAVPVNVKEPTLKVADNPVKVTVSSASCPQPLSPHAFALQPVASKASSFQYACPQVNRPPS